MSKRLHGKQDIVLEQKSAQEVVNFERSIQDDHAKDISDGAGNRRIESKAGAKLSNKRSVMFAEGTKGSSGDVSPVQFTFSIGESQDPEQLVKRFRFDINTCSNATGQGRGRGSSGGSRGGGKGKGKGRKCKGGMGRTSRCSQACREGYYCP